MRVTRAQVLVAVPLAVLVHALLAGLVFTAPAPPGAQAVGLGGVEVSLGPAGGAPGDAATTTAAATPVPPPPTEVPLAEGPPAEAVEPPPDVTPPDATLVAAAVPIEMALVPPPPLEPPPEPVVSRPVTAPPVVPQRKPLPPAAVRPARIVPPKSAPPAPQPVDTPPAVTAASPDAVNADQPPDAASSAATASLAGAGGKAGARDSRESGSADNRSGGGRPGTSADYMAHLLAWLQKHKEYPREARFRHQEGTAMLYFEMDRSGQVMLSRLHRSSGHALLDREVLALIARAAPLPPPPADIPGERVPFVVPIQFSIR